MSEKSTAIQSYIYVPSYQGVLFALYLKKCDVNLTVITPSPIVKKILKEFSINVLYLKLPLLSIRRPITFFRTKKTIKKILQLLDDSNLFFYHNAFDIPGFYLVSLWSLKNKGIIFYSDLDPKRKKYRISNPTKWKEFTLLLYCKFFRKIVHLTMNLKEIEILSSPFPVLGISKNFLQFYGVKNYLKATPNEIRDVANSLDIFKSNCKVVLLGLYGLKKEERKRFLRLLTEFNERKDFILIKPHPSETDYTIYEGFEIVPNYIPAETVINNAFLVIGVASAVMKESLRKNIPTISLIKIVAGQEKSELGFLLNFLSQDYQGEKLYVPSNSFEVNSIIDYYVKKLCC